MKQEHNFKSTFLCGKINFNKEVEKHADADPGKKAQGGTGACSSLKFSSHPDRCFPYLDLGIFFYSKTIYLL